ncbi:conserved hypothetical protein, partial [Ricinus communis]
MVQHLLRRVGVGADQVFEVGQGVVQEVRLDLRLQGGQACLQRGAFQLLFALDGAQGAVALRQLRLQMGGDGVHRVQRLAALHAEEVDAEAAADTHLDRQPRLAGHHHF